MYILQCRTINDILWHNICIDILPSSPLYIFYLQIHKLWQCCWNKKKKESPVKICQMVDFSAGYKPEPKRYKYNLRINLQNYLNKKKIDIYPSQLNSTYISMSTYKM